MWKVGKSNQGKKSWKTTPKRSRFRGEAGNKSENIIKQYVSYQKDSHDGNSQGPER